MAESFPEQIVAAAKSALETIISDGGATYWYTVKATVLYPELTARCFDSSLGTTQEPAVIYVMSPAEEVKDAFTFRYTLGELRVDLALLRYHTAAEANPFNPPSEARWKVQNRLARDAEKALTADRTLGGLALTLDVEVIDRSAENTVDDEFPWAVVFLRVAFLYEHADGTP